MKKYGVNELRKMFLDYFESKGHLIMKSFSLVPRNDASILLINAGMTPLKPYFTGAEIPPSKRVATCQKCIRTGDIDNVGKTARHGTFFEMLGNFSFGDYFKKEAIGWSWEFLTEVVGLDPKRLYPSVYKDDDEAFNIWRDEIGIPEEKIKKFGKEDNFWEHGSGPCGPCSEIYYDRGEKYGCGSPSCGVGCDCDRYMEVWNNVFTQFENDGKGNYTELTSKNIDTGMGLERLAVIVQDVDSIFDVDTIRSLRDEVCSVSDKKYNQNPQDDISIRLITDHIRSATFMISDGIMPTNEGRGYVLRRLIRRAARHGRILNIDGMFLSDLAKTVISGSRDAYPELGEKEEFILRVLDNEESQFNKTIDNGLHILADIRERLIASGDKMLSGEDAFRLYDTYGFPMDLTREIMEEKGFSIDEEGFKAAMKEQQEKARTARGETNYMGAQATVYDEIDTALTTEFVGYENLSCTSKITVLTYRKEGEETDSEIRALLKEKDRGTVITEKSPFYGTMGGQEGDTGEIKTKTGLFKVTDTLHLRGGRIAHIGFVRSGVINAGDEAELIVDAYKRRDTCRNHTATHLLHAALKEVLGAHVEQKGSLVSPEKLRFDFSHFQAMTHDEIRQVEKLVNFTINRELDVKTDLMSLEEAKKTGATALFGEKYGDEVRVVSIGDYSAELCGGTHVKNTAQIGPFKILSESGIASGVRRIEALTGQNVLQHYEEMEGILKKGAELLKASGEDIGSRIMHMLQENKALKAENEALKSKLAKSAASDIMDSVTEVKGVRLLSAAVPEMDMNALRGMGDELKERLGEGVVVLASAKDGKVSLCAMATDGAVSRGAHAGNIVKAAAQVVGGGGGGRPNMASAGGRDASKIPDAVSAVSSILEGMLK